MKKQIIIMASGCLAAFGGTGASAAEISANAALTTDPRPPPRLMPPRTTAVRIVTSMPRPTSALALDRRAAVFL